MKMTRFDLFCKIRIESESTQYFGPIFLESLDNIYEIMHNQVYRLKFEMLYHEPYSVKVPVHFT